MDERGVLAAALDQIRGVDIDEAAVRAHVMRPDNLLGVSSDRNQLAEVVVTETIRAATGQEHAQD